MKYTSHMWILYSNNLEHCVGSITGSGCAVGTTIVAALAVRQQDTPVASLAAVLMDEIAEECAAVKIEVQ